MATKAKAASASFKIMKRINSPGLWLSAAVSLVLIFNLWGTMQLHVSDEGERSLQETLKGFPMLLSPFGNDQRNKLIEPTKLTQAEAARKLPSQTTTTKSETNTKLDLVELAHSLLESFGSPVSSPANNTAFISRLDFPRLTVSSRNPNPSSTVKECHCDLLTLDCLDSIACIPSDSAHRNALVALGMETRKAIVNTADFEGKVHDAAFMPIGKGLQYSTIDSFETWRSDNRLARKHTTFRHEFVNETFYSYCRRKKLHGKSCFFRKLYLPEDNYREGLERSSQEWLEASGEIAALNQVQELFQSFVERQRHDYHDIHAKREHIRTKAVTVEGVRVPTSTMTAFGQLLLFSQFARMLFHRRSFMQDIFEDKLKEMKPALNSSDSSMLPAFTVSVHMRRGDSCSRGDDLNEFPYMKEPSNLNSPAQMTGVRKCYQTQVYLQPLERIRKMIPKNQPLHVYLSTDDTGSIVHEIATDFPHIYANVVDQWIILDYSRKHFQYDFSDTIEAEQNDKKPIMGETAVNDLWLLSHGQAFVGHLGSRFGKSAWLLATARHNAFIPFYSVDGHSFCCDVDEACGKMRKYVIDMQNCMTFSHEYSGQDVGDEYWEVGSLARRKEFHGVLRLKEPQNWTES